MCGIAGIVSDRSLSGDDRATVARMLNRLTHRGPDGRGIRTLRTAVLGHTRLAIIDPEGGKQPIGNEDGTAWIVANGEIYNYKALRSELKSRGHRFTTQTDTETILHLYEEMGPACTQRLRGMFAFAIWDDKRRALLLARDPIGVKPLYYSRCNHSLVFASRLDAILEHPAVERRLDVESLHDYLTYHYIPSPRTILGNVSKLRPAERLIIKNGVQQVQTYWDVPFTVDWLPTEADWMSLIRDGVDVAVENHLVADVRVGAFLSGGLDSSAVVASMARTTAEPVCTNTVGFNDPRFDERGDARRLADRLGTDHREQVVTPDPIDIAETLCECFDEPFADPSAVPTLYASRLARQRVKAVLSGDGGDELFAGYTRYVRQRRERTLRRLTTNSYARGIVLACGAATGRRAAQAARNLTADGDRAHYLNVAWFDPAETDDLLADDVAHALRDHDPFEVLGEHFSNCLADDPLARSQYVDLKTWLADGVLCKTDRASMACGLEVRVPLLDLPFVETMARMPDHLKIHQGRGKYALRRAMEPILGPEVVDRRKRGFEVPLDDWIAGPLRGLVEDTVLASDARIAQWLRPEAVRNVWTQLNSGRRGLGTRMWSLLMLELWSRRCLTPVRQAGSHRETERHSERSEESPPPLVGAGMLPCAQHD